MHGTIYFLLSLMFISSTAFATDDGPDCWSVRGVAKNDVLNIRTEPNARAKIIGTIPANARAVANANDLECPDAQIKDMPAECGTGWCKVSYKSVTGWVNCKFLEGSSDC